MKTKEEVLQEIFDNDPYNILDISHDKGNKLIAEFMECYAMPKYNPSEYEVTFVKHNPNASDEDKLFLLSEMEFHSSWDWLMPVVEHVENLGYEVSIIDNECEISNTGYRVATHVAIKADTKFEAVWLAMIEFITNYDKIKKYDAG